MTDEEGLDHLLDFLPEPTPHTPLTGESLRANEEAMAALLAPGGGMQAWHSPTPLIRGTIPGRARELIRLGVPQADLNAAGSKAVFKALVATAMMWQQANPPGERMEWYRRLTSPEGRLGQQARLDRGRDMGDEWLRKLLDKVWAKAEEVIAKDPAFGRSEVEGRAKALRDEVAEADWTATGFPDDKIVYLFALAEAARRGHSHPVLTVAASARATGVTHGTCYGSLKRLVKAGLLQVHTPGQRTRKGQTGGSGQGMIYTIVALVRSQEGPA